MPKYFENGAILLIRGFKFEDNPDEQRDKILIVLHCDANNVFLIFSKTTSQPIVPDEDLNHGCTNSSERGLSFFMFKKDRTVGENDFSFDKDTIVTFIQNTRKVPINYFSEYISNSKLSILGQLTSTEYKRILKCACGSKVIPKGVKSILLKAKAENQEST